MHGGLRLLAALHGEHRPDFLRDELLHEIFAASARAHSDRPALRSGADSWSYGELRAQASRLARALRRKGIRRGNRIVLCVDRTPAMYAALLAIWEAGAVYVPADPAWPAERVGFLAQDCGAALSIADAAHRAHAGNHCPALLLDELVEASAGESDAPLARAETQADPGDCAYILYTSGSTGRPKGVMISHRAICHFVRSEGSVLGLEATDIVFQGCSLSFDMSLEEIWPAWAAGAALIAPATAILRAASDLADWLATHGVTVWTCVPTLLAMQDAKIPSLRLLNLGGEACPPELVQAWARPGLRILNTYGPTEATITATWAELARGAPVTIGRPLPNYTAYIAQLPGEADETGPDGICVGELCLGGPGLAMGYAGRPELTAERFVPNPAADPVLGDTTLLYRTGDRVRLNAANEFEFLGRVDAQVKIRGFRIELGEIEGALLAEPGVGQAAVLVHHPADGSALLAAYVVARAAGEADEARLRASLGARLPPYMVPEIWTFLPSLPLLASGKIDRKGLPPPGGRRQASSQAARPETPSQAALYAEFSRLFGATELSLDDDFFRDLGGHSLRAATLVSRLRENEGFRYVSMADVYHFPTIRTLAARLDASRPPPAAPEPAAQGRPDSVRHALCGAAQAVGLVLVYALFSLQWLIPYLAYAWLYNQEQFGRPASVAISLVLYVVAIPVMLVVAIAAKWLILGRLRPGDYPLFGFTYFRWWLASRLLDTAPSGYLGRTPLLAWYYRLLGARIGDGVLLAGDPMDAPDCVSVGEGTAFGNGATLACCRVEGGRFKVGQITIGRHCSLGASSVVSAGAAMGDGAVLDDLSLLPSGTRMGAGEKWAGSPARPVGAARQRRPAAPSALRRGAFTAAHAVLVLIFPVFAVLPILPGMILMTELDQNTDAYGFLLLSPLLAISFVASMALQIAALKWLLVGRVRAGRIQVCSGAYLRFWLVDQLMDLSLSIVSSLYATLYLNPWYRLLGIKLGRRVEISTASSVPYDLLRIDDESFVADAVSLGAPRFEGGELVLDQTVIGRRAFIGNSAVIPAGSVVGAGVLIGVLSVPPVNADEAARPGSSWFGSPAMFLPQRQAAAPFAEAATFRPGRGRLAQRLAIEFCRVILPSTVIIALTSLLMSWVVDLDDADWSVPALALVFPFLYAAAAALAAIFVIILKWCVVGRYRPVEKPLWSGFVWRSELVTSTYENLAVPFFADALRGTPFLAMYLRLLGCRIGRRVYLDTTDLTEFDLVTIGDDAALNRDSGPQTHLFEDRVMKIDHVTIGPRCVVGTGSIVLYGARMEPASRLGDLSLLMKGETLPPGTTWHGSPACKCLAGTPLPL